MGATGDRPEGSRSGSVTIIYGSATGLTGTRSERFTANLAGDGYAHVGAGFGTSLAVGNFNGDSYSDVAIGAPYQDLFNSSADVIDSAGMVFVFYGSANGLSDTFPQVWCEEGCGLTQVMRDYDRFGFALAAGDFDGDRISDLAIGVPFQGLNVGGTGFVENGGFVHVLYGRINGGLSNQGHQEFAQDKDPLGNYPIEPDDWFGYSLTSGDFNGDTYDELIIGVPSENINTTENAGVLHVLDGSTNGLAEPDSTTWWHQDSPLTLGGTDEANDQFAYELEALVPPVAPSELRDSADCIATYEPSRITLNFNRPFKAASVRVQVDEADGNYSSPITNHATASTGVSVNLANGEYKWRIRALDTHAHYGAWTADCTFVVTDLNNFVYVPIVIKP